jgi:hypothetical protein
MVKICCYKNTSPLWLELDDNPHCCAADKVDSAQFEFLGSLVTVDAAIKLAGLTTPPRSFLRRHFSATRLESSKFFRSVLRSSHNFEDSGSYVFALFYGAYGLSSLRVGATSVRSMKSLLDSMNIVEYQATSVKNRAAMRWCSRFFFSTLVD